MKKIDVEKKIKDSYIRYSNGTYYRKYQGLILLCVLSIALFFYLSTKPLEEKVQPKVKDGILNLSQWKFHEDGMVQLDGEWGFYWNQLLTYEDFTEHPDRVKLSGYRKIPDVWNNYEVDGNLLPGKGYATYRLKVENADSGEKYGIKILTMSTSYKIMINDEVVAENGTVGNSKRYSKPEYKTQTISISPELEEFEIIVQVSNYTYSRGGMWRPIIFGLDSDIRQLHLQTTRNETLLLGIMLIMSIFHIVLYYYRREDRSLLYAMLGLFITILRILVTGEYYITTLFPAIPFGVVIYLEYITLYWGILFWVMFTSKLFPYEFNPIILRTFQGISLGVSIATAVLPIAVYTRFIIEVEVYIAIISIYGVSRVIVAVKNEREHAQIILYCCILILSAYLIDVCMFLNFLPGFSGGMFVFSVVIANCMQTIIIAKNFSNAVKEWKDGEIAMLQSQISPHFLHNAMNALADISYEGGDKAYDAMVSFSEYLRYSYDLVPQTKNVLVSKEIELVESYLKIEKFRFLDKLQYEIHMEKSNQIQIPPFSIQPLVENAVRHGVSKKKDGGWIKVIGEQLDQMYKITVEDNGVGISQEIINGLEMGKKVDTMGHGLYNVNKRLMGEYKSKLHINRKDDGGTVIFFYVKVR